jgi:hypothetical protein
VKYIVIISYTRAFNASNVPNLPSHAELAAEDGDVFLILLFARVVSVAVVVVVVVVRADRISASNFSYSSGLIFPD